MKILHVELILWMEIAYNLCSKPSRIDKYYESRLQHPVVQQLDKHHNTTKIYPQI